MARDPINLDDAELRRLLARTLELAAKERPGLVRELLAIQVKAIDANMASGPHSGGAVPLGIRTGALRRSFVKGQVEVSGSPQSEVVGGTLGTNLPYAAVHEGIDESDTPFVIVPKKAKALAIPVGPALTDKGVESKEAHNLLVNHKLQFASFGTDGKDCIGRLGLWNENAKWEMGKEPFETFYLLLKKVTIKPTHFVSKAIIASKEAVDSFATDTVLGWMDSGATS